MPPGEELEKMKGVRRIDPHPLCFGARSLRTGRKPGIDLRTHTFRVEIDAYPRECSNTLKQGIWQGHGPLQWHVWV
jgi:hypothetical protein